MRLGKAYGLLLALLCLAACRREIGPGPEGQPGQGGTSAYYQYGLAQVDIVTDDGAAVDSKDPADYRACTVTVDGKGVFDNLKARGEIRGRGNSTWNWYPKKPYRIKLEESAPLLGMKKNKDWVLLADYRDVTHMMNNVGFTLAHELGLPCANRSRYATVRLNGRDLGLYLITEQVEEGTNRVPLDADEGILLTLDINDGPTDEPQATDNFYTAVFRMDAAVKYPRDADKSVVRRVKNAFEELEEAIVDEDWDDIRELLDVESMIHYILIQELICNVEMDNYPGLRSGFIHRRDNGAKWVMGPLWDCDGGFSYDWSDMYDSRGWGHTYFRDYRTLIFGSDPYRHRGAYGATASDFFCRLFGIPAFVRQFQARWEEVHEDLLAALLEHLERTEELIGAAAQEDMALWGIGNYVHQREYAALVTWLTRRFDYLDSVIRNYPVQ